ncbi:hypothetical protein SMMN14_03123 [Sphaerulina musiva]
MTFQFWPTEHAIHTDQAATSTIPWGLVPMRTPNVYECAFSVEFTLSSSYFTNSGDSAYGSSWDHEDASLARSDSMFVDETSRASSSPWSLYSVEWDEPWPSFDRPEFSDVETSKYELPTSCNSFQDSAGGSPSTAQGRNASTSQEGSQGLTADPSGGKRQRGDTESPNGLREPAAKRTRRGARASRKQPEIECICEYLTPNDAS